MNVKLVNTAVSLLAGQKKEELSASDDEKSCDYDNSKSKKL